MSYNNIGCTETVAVLVNYSLGLPVGTAGNSHWTTPLAATVPGPLAIDSLRGGATTTACKFGYLDKRSIKA
jgi:hypothetical protein